MKTSAFPGRLLLALILAVPCLLRADIALAPLFTDHAVLQRDHPVRIWGRAAANEKVAVTFGGQQQAALPDGHGDWSVTLAPMPASAEPRDLTVSGLTTVVCHDVVVGEVWFCSGQSNMEWDVRRSEDAGAVMAAATFPQIRQFLASRQAVELRNVATVPEWAPCSPDTVGSFSAVAYFFAAALHRELRIPIGVINSSWGGSPIETWLSRDALSAEPRFDVTWKRWSDEIAAYPERMRQYRSALAVWQAEADRAAKAGSESTVKRPRLPAEPDNFSRPARLFETMVAPYAGYSLRGFLWYQGEQNVSRAGEYQPLLVALIRDWRARWNDPVAPFYLVQLPNFASGDPAGVSWPALRAAQAAALTEPATAMAVTIDVGDPANIHPVNKKPVGERLARIALSRDYGRTTEYRGPSFGQMNVEGGRIRVALEHAEGLHARGGAPTGFEIAGADQRFVPAQAVIDGQSVVMSAPGVAAPVAVRYAWRNAPNANLYNGADLPAAPFRTDAW